MAMFTTLSVVIWFSTDTLGIFATLFYVFTSRVVIYDILNMAMISRQCGENRHTDIAYFAKLIHTKKLIHCVAIFTIMYGNYYPPHEKFKLICIAKFSKRT